MIFPLSWDLVAIIYTHMFPDTLISVKSMLVRMEMHLFHVIFFLTHTLPCYGYCMNPGSSLYLRTFPLDRTVQVYGQT